VSRYAEGTSVAPEKSRAEIEGTLRRYGADGFASGWDDQEARAFIQFRLKERYVRIVLPLPTLKEQPTRNGRGNALTPKQRSNLLEQATRQRWRALLLVTKAKLEAVASRVSTFEQEFLPYIVLPDGRTVGDVALPQVAQAYLAGAGTVRMIPQSVTAEPID
jgi:hypothetical protein